MLNLSLDIGYMPIFLPDHPLDLFNPLFQKDFEVFVLFSLFDPLGVWESFEGELGGLVLVVPRRDYERGHESLTKRIFTEHGGRWFFLLGHQPDSPKVGLGLFLIRICANLFLLGEVLSNFDQDLLSSLLLLSLNDERHRFRLSGLLDVLVDLQRH